MVNNSSGSNTGGSLFQTNLAANGILYADSSGVVNSTAVGTATQILTSNGAGVAPTFQASTGVTGPGSSTTNSIATWNGAGGTALFSRGTPLVDSSGRMTNTNQPCFLATMTVAVTNAWGDGGTYTVAFNNSVFDQASNYNTGTGVFTAPVTGKYLFSAAVSLTNSGGLTSSANIFLTATSRTLVLMGAAFVTTDPSNILSQWGTCIVDMTANDTAKIQIQGSTAAASKTGTFFGGAGSSFTWFSGQLIC